MTRDSAILTEHGIAPSDIGKSTGRLYPTHDEVAHWLTTCTSHAVGEKATNSKTGCAPNRNSCGTTRNCEMRAKRHKHE